MPDKNKKRTASRPADELYLRRMTIDEALLKLDRYLDDAFMAGLSQVTIIHGKGTGSLRRAVREQLGGHSLVGSYRPGAYGEGEEGITIAYLVQR